MTNQEFMNEFYKDTDKWTGMDNMPPYVSGGRCALFMAYGRGENPYLTPAQWEDLKDFTPEEVLGLMKKKEPEMPEGEWRPKADDPSVVEWWGTSELLREMEEQNASQTHEVARRATISPPPYPPYGLDKQIDPRASSEEKA